MLARTLAALALCALAFTPSARAAGASPDDQPLERLATSRGYAVVVFEVLRVSPGAATNGDPPTLAVQVERVLLGKLGAGTRVARWIPAPLKLAARGAYAERLQKAWTDTPLAAPPVGSRVLALIHEVGAVTEVLARYRGPATATAETALWQLAATSKKASFAARKAARKELKARTKDEALRLAEADVSPLIARSTVIAVGRFAPLAPGSDGQEVLLTLREGPRGVDPDATELKLFLPTPEERERYVLGATVVAFLTPGVWYAPDGTLLEGLRPVDPRFGVLPATRATLRTVRAAMPPPSREAAPAGDAAPAGSELPDEERHP